MANNRLCPDAKSLVLLSVYSQMWLVLVHKWLRIPNTNILCHLPRENNEDMDL